MLVTASIVLYNHESTLIQKLCESLIYQGVSYVYIVDNSLENSEIFFRSISKIIYYHSPQNPGFGASHNVAINKAIESGGKYHFVVNPDINLGDNVIESMIRFMQKEKGIGMMMPQVLNIDGSVQFLPKLLPSPISLFKRKFPNYFKSFITKYELRFVSSEMIYSCPILSGCFTLLNLDVIQLVGGYDERFFMYFEDFDLSRRVNRFYKTLYFPKVHVTHAYNSEANKSIKLLLIFLSSAIRYFNKWGWIFDLNRKKVNSKTLNQFIS